MPASRHDYEIHPCFYTGPALTAGQLPPLDGNFLNPNNPNWSSQRPILYDLDISAGSTLSPSHRSFLPQPATGRIRLQQVNHDLNPLHASLTAAQSAEQSAPVWTAIILATPPASPGRIPTTQHLFALGRTRPIPPSELAATAPVTYRFDGALADHYTEDRTIIPLNAAALASALAPHGLLIRNIPRKAGQTQADAINAHALATTINELSGTLRNLIIKSQPILDAHAFESPRGQTLFAGRPPRGPVNPPTQLSYRSAAGTSFAQYNPSLVHNRALATTAPLLPPTKVSLSQSNVIISPPETFAIFNYYKPPTGSVAIGGSFRITKARIVRTFRGLRYDNWQDWSTIPTTLPTITAGTPGDRNLIVGSIDFQVSSARLKADIYMMAYQTSTNLIIELGLTNITQNASISDIVIWFDSPNGITVYLPQQTSQSPTLLLQDTDSIIRHGRHSLPLLPTLDITASTTIPYLDDVSNPPLTATLRLPFRQRSTNPATHLLPALIPESALGAHFPLTITPATSAYTWQLMARRLVQPFNQTPYIDAQFLAYP